ncbi:MAG TPA: hypothetical protein VGG70_05920 [Candidatus Cybelea sp.]|jgi:hypothetical protein
MRDPLTRYLSTNYLKFYSVPFLFWLLVVVIETRASHDPYLGLVFLSYIATFTLFALVFYLAINNEFETLQTFGVSFGRLALPVFSVSLTLQASISAFAVIASSDRLRATAYAMWTFLAVLLCYWTTLKVIWDQREAATFRACFSGFAAQTAVLLLWGTAPLFYQLVHK